MQNLDLEVKKRLDRGDKESDIRKFVRNQLKLGKTQGNVVYNRIKSKISAPQADDYSAAIKQEKSKMSNLEFDKKYIYNKEEKTYVVFLKSAGRAILVSEETHNNMLRAYTSKEEVKVEDICSANGFPHGLFHEYKTIFGWTRNGSALSDETIENNSVEDLVEDTVQLKRWEVLQESKKRLWKETENNSRKWMEFEEDYLKPFREVIDSWQPISQPIVELKEKPKTGLTFIAALSDNHIGELFEKHKSFHGKEFNSEIACKIIDDYFLQIKQRLELRSEKFERGIVVVTGDYLHSCIDGNTRKGTHLHSDKTNQDMFKIGLDAMARFIENFSKLFPRTKVVTVNGNHESLLLVYLMLAIEKQFQYDENVEFLISEAWAKSFKIGKVAVIIMHGGHDTIKKDLPPVGLRLKNFIQELFLTKQDELADTTQRIVISGHKHSFTQFDFGSFEFYTLGSSVLGDSYADALGLYSTPRQNCLILDDNHVLETLHFYF